METALLENPETINRGSQPGDAPGTANRKPGAMNTNPPQGGQDNHGQPPPRKGTRRALVFVVLAIGILFVGAGVWHLLGKTPTSATAAAPGAAPVPVTVQTIASRRLRLWNDFSGRLRAVNSADIRPEVSGRITEVRFQDGQSVRAGDVLVVIDPRIYEAAVARAEARVAAARATLQLTTSNETRDTALLKTRAISQREFDQTDSANNAATAALLGAQADLKTAQVDLDHAYVKAPISGRVSRAELTVGNLLQSGAGAPLLTSIVSEDGIYADFEVDEQTYLQTVRDAAVGNSQEGQIPVELVVPGDAEQVYRGFIQNFDNRLDPQSGTIRARARFDNAGATLVPGMFVSVRLASSRERDLMMVPDRAVGFDQSKKFVFVVSRENKVAYREVELGHEVSGQRVVQKGLEPGDRVIVDGVQRMRPEATVDPKEVEPATLAALNSGSVEQKEAMR